MRFIYNLDAGDYSTSSSVNEPDAELCTPGCHPHGANHRLIRGRVVFRRKRRTASRPDLQRSQENVCTVGSSSVYGNRWPAGGYCGQTTIEHNPIRSSRSHESLLSYSTTSHMIDMGMI
ncbi:unnamed protein product [Toxocara canis]|uniref:Uncharacterized protein n=1 Tax=Toxocara canis TaxID=6265 RepID=A0A183V5N0_TOXCA|nr:unnamed protein product [Toxocara canis]